MATAGLLLQGCCWAGLALLGLLALLRVVAWDDLEPLVVVDALTVVAYLPAWVVAVGALVFRRWWLAGAALVVVGAQLAFVAPELMAASPVPAWARHATTIRVFDANIDKSLTFHTGYVRAIEADRPDVITMQEFSPPAYAAMKASGVLRPYGWQCVYPGYGAAGFLLASRWPLSGCQLHDVRWSGGVMPYMVTATLATPAGPVAVRVVHTMAPFPTYWHEWAHVLRLVAASVRASGTDHMLMAGDFNATWDNRGFFALVHDGLTDGAAARGQALAMTWPDGAVVPAFVRIDHVLTGRNMVVTAIAAHSGTGIDSDHRYLTVTVAVRG